MTERSRVTRAPEDILIAILTQTESQLSGLSTVQITIDHKSPDLQNIALESTRNLFVQQSPDTYKASQINISIFINILIGVKANGWTLMGTNAFLNNGKQEVVKTFYFEKIGAAKGSTATKLNNGTSSSSPAVRSSQAGPVAAAIENGRYPIVSNGTVVPVRSTPESSPRDRDIPKNSPRDAPATNRRQATEEQKDHRINGNTGTAQVRRNSLENAEAVLLRDTASQRELTSQREQASQREAANQKDREAANQRERDAVIQRERDAVSQRERDAASQRERDTVSQREKEAANQREREIVNQRERDAATQRELNNQRELIPRATPIYENSTTSRASPPTPPLDSKSPNNAAGPGAIDFNKFPARLRPSPTAKGDKAVSAVPSDIQKKNAEYFKRMKKEQDQEKKKLEEEELKLDVTELRRRKEVAALAEAHENSKTAHFSRLGANFVPGRDILSAAARPKGPI